MATKKTTASAKKVATKTAKKSAKKTTKKVAAKKVTKKVAKKSAKKITKKVTAAEQELNLEVKARATTEAIQQQAYLNYVERMQSGLPGSPELDWAKAEQDLA